MLLCVPHKVNQILPALLLSSCEGIHSNLTDSHAGAAGACTDGVTEERTKTQESDYQQTHAEVLMWQSNKLLLVFCGRIEKAGDKIMASHLSWSAPEQICASAGKRCLR